ncbi:hypothetical protein DYB32_007640 [Aphanomyces invadans]|uniref:V-SNARE coiled-coil homology domain-containing protein n=1 Tax=Aphanomyces invadans TaxID=157072 RepID=A0A418ANA2_9STRA|nr:hypothetical protein DYB32_007640 [Aphanomyces invadans]
MWKGLFKPRPAKATLPSINQTEEHATEAGETPVDKKRMEDSHDEAAPDNDAMYVLANFTGLLIVQGATEKRQIRYVMEVKKRKEYTDPSSSQNMSKLNNDLADIHNVMRQNIQEVLNRGEAIDRVSQISSNIADRSKEFKWGAKKLSLQAMYQKYGPLVAIALFVVLVIYFKFF